MSADLYSTLYVCVSEVFDMHAAVRATSARIRELECDDLVDENAGSELRRLCSLVEKQAERLAAALDLAATKHLRRRAS